MIFFWSTITAPSASFSLTGDQLNSSVKPDWPSMGNLDVFLWDSNCDKIQTVTLDQRSRISDPECHRRNAGPTYYFSVKYDTSTLTGSRSRRPAISTRR